MPLHLVDYKRPPQDNGRGIVGYPTAGWKGGDRGYDYWISELQQLGVKWLRIVDDSGDSLALCERLLMAGIFPIVKILRRDLPPNDSPEPNPGHISAREELTIKKLLDLGVAYFETNNEPDSPSEWKQGATPGNLEETAKLVALNWLFDARFIIEAGGYPALPAVSSGSAMDLLGALASLGRQDILLDGCWIAVHNFGHNRPLNFPNDRVNQNGAPLSPQEYDYGSMTEWVWWDTALGRANTLEEINALRAARKSAGQVIAHDHAAFREYEYMDALAKKYLGRSIPIIATEGGYQVGRRTDLRYPRITPALQADLTVALYEFMQRDAPDYYFSACPWLLVGDPKTQASAWYSDFWDKKIRQGNASGANAADLPPVAVSDYRVGERLPVVAAVQAMTTVSRTGPRIAMPAPAPAAPAIAPSMMPPPPPPPSEESIYLVQHGETLTSIAKKFGVAIQSLALVNALGESARVIAGQRLVIPPPPDVMPPALPEEPMSAPGTYAPVDAEHRATAPQFTAPPPTGSPQSAPPPMPEWFASPQAPPQTTPPPAPPSRYVPPPQHTAPSYNPQPTSIVQKSAPAPLPRPAAPPPAAPRPAPPRPPRAPGVVSPLDPRLAALNVRIEYANVKPGEPYWKLIRAEYQDPTQSNGNHHMLYSLLDDKGKPVLVQRVFQGLANIQADSFTDAFGRAKIPMWENYNPDNGETGPYSAWVAGLPGDKVVGLGMPNGMSVNFVLTWQKTIK